MLRSQTRRDENGLSFGEAMRLLAGANVSTEDTAIADADWAQVAAGPWLAETLKGLRSPEGLAQVDPGDALKGTLRPYQQVGVRWLYLLAKLGLGACLADDMGLGKTIQVLLCCWSSSGRRARNLSQALLVAPASLLANWAAEMNASRLIEGAVAHPSALPAAEIGSQRNALRMWIW
jgi:non-specific serine/threonine protein kinase